MITFAEFKKFFLFNLIGALIICALVAVVTVLIGSFTEITEKVLFTLAMVILHSLICLGFIWDNERRDTFDRLAFFTNVLFLLIVLSFLTSIFGIWDIVNGEWIGHLYLTYFLLGFASLHGDILSKALNKENYLDVVVYLNYVFMVIVVLMLLPVIYVDNATRELGEMYFRFLGAAGIIDGTLSVLAMIFLRVYMHGHPKEENPLDNRLQGQPVLKSEKKGWSIWVWILIIYLIVQILFPLLGLAFRGSL
jgi:hypothetical protein